ncbi:MAG: hypothetical protein PUB52_10515 [Lachnospiraceae bacterium]|nr:hypothetical protein [Lachnospiraceae bacterium]
MTQLLEIKDKLIRVFGAYETYIVPALKFIVALTIFLMINSSIGFMGKISSVPVALILALVCCLLPVNGTILLAAIVILLDMYSLSIEAAAVTFVLFAIIYFAYFRFSPKDGYAAILTPIAFKFNMPYLVPVADGLLRPVQSLVAMVCGTVVFYYIDGVRMSAAVLSDSASEDVGASKLNVLTGQVSGNKEMVLVLAIMVLAYFIVYFVRRMEIEHAWAIAITAGLAFQFVGLLAGYLILNLSGKILGLIIGTVLSALFSWFIKFFAMDLDYARTERVQFQDDDYYYYVKAIPKKMVPSRSKTVKRFGNTSSMGKKIGHEGSRIITDDEIERKVIAEELDIDEDLLK